MCCLETVNAGEREQDREDEIKFGELFFTGKVAALRTGSFPTYEKIRKYQEQMGKPLPVFMRQRGPKKFHNLFVPPRITKRLTTLLEDFRQKNLSETELKAEMEVVERDWFKYMESEKPNEYKVVLMRDTNIELRFATERSSRDEKNKIKKDKQEEEAAAK